jgi:hypothetical protein
MTSQIILPVQGETFAGRDLPQGAKMQRFRIDDNAVKVEDHSGEHQSFSLTIGASRRDIRMAFPRVKLKVCEEAATEVPEVANPRRMLVLSLANFIVLSCRGYGKNMRDSPGQ